MKKEKEEAKIRSAFLQGILATAKGDPSLLINEEIKKLMAKPYKEALKYMENVAKKKDKATLGEIMVAKKIGDLMGFVSKK